MSTEALTTGFDYETILASGVYFIEAIGLRRIKIGYSRDIARRFQQIRTSAPVPIRLVGVIANASQSLERSLHDRFAADRVINEWFKASPALNDYMSRHATAWEIPAAVMAHSARLFVKLRMLFDEMTDEERITAFKAWNEWCGGWCVG